MKYTFIVAAAGSGKRMGLGYPKQFLEYQGKPIFIKTLEKIDQNPRVTDIIVVTNKEYTEKVEKLCEKYRIKKIKCVVQGGKERQDSIQNALEKTGNSEIIAVQDGVRPFIENRFIEDSYRILEKNCDVDGVVIGVPVKDTIKLVDKDGFITSTPDRSLLMAAQTPQVFRGEILKKAYSDASKSNYLGTDDSSLVERINGKVIVLEGSYNNIKITTQEDLKYL
ncbi:2-C-methyl-D-erythritol 4-phosphate cytidylyltransferase [Ilyobacter polytropus DSM 2926]|uniref:2-C-methyl-D-erythritol 4-phosphate cytidylyltransferase n=2 Tax=Ilyobacter TaxID=167639 RepID=E3H9T6_ILYPC|nr:2-C-methyl-D-erythritol 4-phosphate cytidylyltransferase [Ilyobacter polytropus]ADO83615.1 2-C-methyl-D-erythritol 4-phosphate cytidylyltransferase [Ilyobacter polytropus DSM 2926]